ncbi:MAG: hypothetical protein AAF843_15850 [Bacteroidota bacterium]
MNRTSYILWSVFLVFMACSPGVMPTADNAEKYKEDLSYLRPTYPDVSNVNDTTSTQEGEVISELVDPSFDDTEKLNAVLDSIDVIRKDVRFVNGFTIQVYSGYDSEAATKARGRVYSILEDSKPSLKFEEPNFKVKVGKYYSRLEAQGDYALIKEKFSSALIIPERIYIQ